MYNAFFEFEKNPFASTPDLAFFYRSQQHDASLRSLTFAVQARMGLTSLIGEQGTGKTMVLECLRESLEATQIHCAFLRESHISTSRFFQTIASDLNLRCQGTSAYQVFSALHQFALQQALKGRTVALLVDEAHNLPGDVLNEILHLASLHSDKTKLLQTVLAGRPELHATLDALNLERLQQHAILSCTLQPFTAQETQDYIEFRLAQAGMPGQTVFPREAIAKIYERSRGFAPAIHAICEGLLLAAFSARSKACTQEILDQVFRKHECDSGVLEIAPTVVAVTRIDLASLIIPSEPEPAILTALLDLTSGAIPSFPPPLPLKENQLLEPQQVILQMTFPMGKFVIPVGEFLVGSKTPIRLSFDASTRVPPPLPVGPGELLAPLSIALPQVYPMRKLALPVREFALGSKKPMRLGDGAKADSSIHPEVHPIPSSPSVSRPVLSGSVAGAEPRPEHRLQPLRSNWEALNSTPSVTPATAIDFSSIALPPATSIVESLRARMAMLTPLGVNKLAPLPYTYSAKPSAGRLNRVDPQAISLPNPEPGKPMHPAADFRPAGAERVPLVPLPARPEPPSAATGLRNVLPTAIRFTEPQLCHPTVSAGEGSRAGAPGIQKSDLISLKCGLKPEPAVEGAPSGAYSFPVRCASDLHPMHPAAKLQPAGTIQLPRVPMTPFGLAECDPPSVRTSGNVQFEPLNPENPIGPAMAAALTASCEPNLRKPNRPLPMDCNVSPAVPPAERPITTFLNTLPSLQPWRPISKLEPVDPRRSFLLLSAPPSPEASIEKKKSVSSHGMWLLAVAVPILAGLTLYAASPVMRSASGAVNDGWRRAHQAVLDRATIALNEDFRSSLDDWMNRGGARPSWPSDAAGFVQPGALALYRPSLGLADYQMQFVGTIDKKALSWVVRAADFNNYYALRLTVLKPGPVPAIGVTRYAVINGKMQNQVTTPLLMSARSDTVYRVSMDVRGNHFALSVQGQPVASWTEPKLPAGGIGFFSEQDAGSRVTGVHIKGQDDPLGRLCALLAPSEVSSYRASLSERAAMVLTSEMKMSGAGRGGLYSSSPGNASRLPRGTARLDPAFWQVPEVAVPNARRCGPATNRIGFVRPRPAVRYTGVPASTTCY